MGICVCKAKKSIGTREQLRVAILRAVEDDRLPHLEKLISLLVHRTVPLSFSLAPDDTILTVQGISLNALAYSFRLGRCAIARFLIEQAQCSVEKLYAIYREAGKSPIDVLCEYGHLELLRYFLRVHLDYISKSAALIPTMNENWEERSLFGDSSGQQIVLQQPVVNTQTAIQRAAERGHSAIVEFFVEFFTGIEPVPKDFDVHSEDDRSGETCALIASRNGNCDLLRFLHEKCNADFQKLNKRKESALQLAIIGLKRHPNNGDFLGCIKYLVEVVGVDIRYEYEETLLLSEDKIVVDYLEKKLRAMGIDADKQKVEAEYALGREKLRNTVKTDLALEERIREAGPDFQLLDLFREELASRSYISSISHRSITLFEATPQLL